MPILHDAQRRHAQHYAHVTDQVGDRYHEGYAGVNYYFYDHKLKLQTGLQFADMNSRDADTYSGTSWTTGIRIGW